MGPRSSGRCPAANRQSRTLVRRAAPNRWIRVTNPTINVIARTSSRESVGYFTFAGTTVVSARTWPVLATLASLALLSSTH